MPATPIVAWLLLHPAAVLLPVWTAAAADAGRRGLLGTARDKAAGVLWALLLCAGAAAALDAGPAPLARGFHDGGLGLGLQWSVIAGLVLLNAPTRAGTPGWRSLLPLVLVAGQAGGALLTGVVVAATGAMERGRTGRGWLALGLSCLALAHGIDLESLRAWVWLRGAGLGMDPASHVVDLGEHLVRAAGWAGVALALRRRTT